jgi:hypothetical protein
LRESVRLKLDAVWEFAQCSVCLCELAPPGRFSCASFPVRLRMCGKVSIGVKLFGASEWFLRPIEVWFNLLLLLVK